MLLGIVGPLLLMLASGVFAARSIASASGRATEALRTEARTSNQLAARFAARSLENELLRYFQVLERESGLAETRQILRNVLQSTELTEMRRQIVEAPSQAIANRSQFLHHATRRTLDDQIEARLASYAGAEEGRPGVSTMFITDAEGTIISIALDTKVDETQLSTGYNFAFRTYFHGGRDDLPRDTAIDSVVPLSRPHLSAAFQSTATGLWKLAFSMPIYLNSADQESGRSTEGTPRKPDGVFVITTNLGDFESMRDGQLNDQLAVVIEARDGPLRGTILQHPLMDQQTGAGGALAGKRFQVSAEALDNLLGGTDIDYRDPMASAPGGDVYSGRWLAALAPITLPKELTTTPEKDGDQTAATTDLLVLVQYRLSKVFEPVGDLQRQLLIEGSITLTLIFALTAAMWIYVNRLNDPTRFDDPVDESPDPQAAASDQPTIGVR
jgi:hypothetical protein